MSMCSDFQPEYSNLNYVKHKLGNLLLYLHYLVPLCSEPSILSRAATGNGQKTDKSEF